jgi:hypothetical protein
MIEVEEHYAVGGESDAEGREALADAQEHSPVATLPNSEESALDIHKPKPVHNAREFLSEILIIVIGVMIALAGEQVVEALHERAVSSEARENINGEIGRDLDIFRRRSTVQPCIDKRLRQIDYLLTSTPLGAQLPRPLWIGRPQIWDVTESRINAATSGARTALLSTTQQATYGEIYGQFRVLDQSQDMEQVAWAHLRALETLPTLDAESRANLIEALEEARYANFRILVAAEQAKTLAKNTGVQAVRSPYAEGSRSACIPINTTREQALKMTIVGRSPIAEP